LSLRAGSRLSPPIPFGPVLPLSDFALPPSNNGMVARRARGRIREKPEVLTPGSGGYAASNMASRRVISLRERTPTLR
jgi:hypothetical protein